MSVSMRDEDMVPGEDIKHWCPSCGHEIVPVDPDARDDEWIHASEEANILCEEVILLSPVCHIEFILCHQDGTWDTEIVEVPPILHHEDCTNGNRVDWYYKVHDPVHVAHVGVFHLEPYA